MNGWWMLLARRSCFVDVLDCMDSEQPDFNINTIVDTLIPAWLSGALHIAIAP